MARQCLTESLLLATAGGALGLVVVTLGLLAAWSLARFVAAFLFEVPAHAVGVYAAVATVVVLSGLLATLLPARRAAKVDPLVALRAE